MVNCGCYELQDDYIRVTSFIRMYNYKWKSNYFWDRIDV